jgi:hypothetical protein
MHEAVKLLGKTGSIKMGWKIAFVMHSIGCFTVVGFIVVL